MQLIQCIYAPMFCVQPGKECHLGGCKNYIFYSDDMHQKQHWHYQWHLRASHDKHAGENYQTLSAAACNVTWSPHSPILYVSMHQYINYTNSRKSGGMIFWDKENYHTWTFSCSIVCTS